MPESLQCLDLLDFSRPHENGYLDAQMIMLLADRGVPLQNLERLQSGYYGLLEGVWKETTEYFFAFKGEFGLLEEIKVSRMDGQMKKRLKSVTNKEFEEMKKADGCTGILVPHFRVVFAVCDPYNKLKYGECYFNPTMPEHEANSFPGADQRFIVMRNPCYHPGDVRVLRLTDEKQGYENLPDCLVLPVKGPRPHAFECGGGTLGGDKFFVSLNKNIIPEAAEKPCNYPLKKFPGIRKATSYLVSHVLWSYLISPRKRNQRGRQEMQEYFVTFTENLPQRIDATYMKYAAVFGPSSKQCRKLSNLSYEAVNLLKDRVTLEKEFLKLEKKKPRAKSNVDPSTLSVSYDGTTLLLPTNEEQDVEHRLPGETSRLPRFMRRSLPRNYAHEAKTKIEKNAREYIQRVQREFQKFVA